MAAPGLSEVDRQRVFANGVAELIYNAGLTVLISAPALLVGYWLLRPPGSKAPPA